MSERALQEPQELRRGLRAIAAGLVDRVAGPEMPRARNDDGAGEEAGLLERGEEHLRLGLRIDDVVVGAVDQQKARAGILPLLDGRVAGRRGVEIEPAVLHWRGP